MGDKRVESRAFALVNVGSFSWFIWFCGFAVSWLCALLRWGWLIGWLGRFRKIQKEGRGLSNRIDCEARCISECVAGGTE